IAVTLFTFAACVGCNDKPKAKAQADDEKPKSVHPAWVPELDKEGTAEPTINLRDPPPPAQAEDEPAAGDAGKTAAASDGGKAKPALASKDGVKLLEAGGDPKKKLRYAFKVGQNETMLIDLKMSISMQAGAMKQPDNAVPGV